MKRALWFLWNYYIGVVLGCVVVPGVIVLVGTQWLHIEYLATYYYMLPMVAVVYVAIFSFSLTTLYRNVALSFNCRRTDFFWASQIAFVVTPTVGMAFIWLLGALPNLLGLEYFFQKEDSFMNGVPIYIQPNILLVLLIICLLLQPIGAAMGELYSRSKLWSTIGLVVVMLLAVGGTVVLMFLSDGTISPISQGVKIAVTVIVAVLGIICAVCEVYFYHSNGRAMVK